MVKSCALFAFYVVLLFGIPAALTVVIFNILVGSYGHG